MELVIRTEVDCTSWDIYDEHPTPQVIRYSKEARFVMPDGVSTVVVRNSIDLPEIREYLRLALAETEAAILSEGAIRE